MNTNIKSDLGDTIRIAVDHGDMPDQEIWYRLMVVGGEPELVPFSPTDDEVPHHTVLIDVSE